MNNNLGDRIKAYELQFTQDIIPNTLPMIVRLDGKAFHSFTRGLKKPYDFGLQSLMQQTMYYITSRYAFDIGYTQSDEITLIKICRKKETQLPFGGKVFKLLSVLASEVSVYFNKNLDSHLPGNEKDATFDCRVFSVPSVVEAVNALRWRFQDCVRNSIAMMAHWKFSHKALQYKSTKELLELCPEWNEQSRATKYGSLFISTPHGHTSKSIDMRGMEWEKLLNELNLTDVNLPS